MVEAEAPRVAPADRKNLGAPRAPEVGLVDRRRVRLEIGDVAMVDIDAKDLAQQQIDVLRIVRRIVGASAVAHTYLQIAVPAEGEHAAVVIRIDRMRYPEQHRTVRTGDVQI